MRLWRLDAGDQTLVLMVADGRMAEAIHWGARLPGSEDLTQLAAAHRGDLGGGTLDAVVPLSICPEARAGFPGQPGASLRHADGTPLMPHFRFLRAEGDDPLALLFRDEANELTYIARFETAATGVITASARIEADAPLRVDWLAAPVLPGPQAGADIVDWHGTWLREFHRNRTPWSAGIRLRESRTGRSGHEHFPGAILPARGATRAAGEVHALHLAWSGGHRFVAEELPDGRRQVQIGRAWGSHPDPVTAIDSPALLMACSSEGEAGIARAFQRHLRDRIVDWPDPDRPRPVHYNCWEAVYFNQSFDTLADIATRAAALGAERFVLDDGWFGRRDDETTSLGDWRVDDRKWPEGLPPLIGHVRNAGMSFGLWVEPEMVSIDSDLYRAHPDWLLGDPDQLPGRGQHVLDMARDEVRAHLLEALDRLLTDHDIDYLKWDHNRVLPRVDAAQTEGLYDLIDRLRCAHPAVEIESCASGGGRIDAGILARTHRVWLSDSNDALERLRMQHEAALVLPAAITGSHVGPRTCHSSGRILPMAFRAWVAAQRHMGIEMDPRELTGDEAGILARVIDWWKVNRHWTMRADILPLDSDDPAIVPEIQIARDGSRFVAFAGRVASSTQALPRPLRLAGLEPDARYAVRLLNPEEAPPQSRGAVALKDGPLSLSGRALMTTGLRLLWSWPATMWILEGTRL